MTSIEKRLDRFDEESDDQLVELARTARDGYTTRSADAEDLAQEVFVKAFFGLRRFEGRAQFRTWLQRNKLNHCLNHLRKTRGAIMVDIDDVAFENHRARPGTSAAVQLEVS